MAVYKCNICGGDLEIVDLKARLAKCPYCGSMSTLPEDKSNQTINLLNRANYLRAHSEFDKAASTYERVLEFNPHEAEVYWGLCLCKYGVEYVDDPENGKKVPTCHRTLPTSIFSDLDYNQAIEKATPEMCRVYEQSASDIDEIQKGIIAISQKEEPYDIFISYKDTDASGNRTEDSVNAQNLYKALTDEGYRVFFSRISLEGKLGNQYEPYIYSALTTAKVMIVYGSTSENFSAPWVRNEWSRFLAMQREDGGKLLIPAYQNMSPYELPDELSNLQAQDMGKIGATQDLLYGISKVLTPNEQKEGDVSGIASQIQKLLMRGNMALEDGEWEKSESFFEQVLNLNPQSAEAYLGQFLSQERCTNLEDLVQVHLARTKTATAEMKTAIEQDISEEEKIVQQNIVKDYLDENEIRALMPYDRSYRSIQDSRRQQLQDEQRRLSSNHLLNRARQFADSSLEAQIDDVCDSIYKHMTLRIEQAVSQDNKSKKVAELSYAEHLSKVKKEAEQLRNHAKRREAENKAWIKRGLFGGLIIAMIDVLAIVNDTITMVLNPFYGLVSVSWSGTLVQLLITLLLAALIGTIIGYHLMKKSKKKELENFENYLKSRDNYFKRGFYGGFAAAIICVGMCIADGTCFYFNGTYFELCGRGIKICLWVILLGIIADTIADYRFVKIYREKSKKTVKKILLKIRNNVFAFIAVFILSWILIIYILKYFSIANILLQILT